MFSIPSGEEVKNLRKRANLTQKELAEKTGLSQGLIAKIENNTVDPKASTLRKILNVLENEMKVKQGHDMKACDIMTKKVISINHDETVRRALELMTAYSISQLPV
ncbi:MAG: helix-turn-helix domain-containing protein, partial [Thermoproteota archaeon]